MTPAMIETPRVLLVRRARYGRWGLFPVDPGLYFKSFHRPVEVKDHISKYRSAAVDLVEHELRSLDQPSLTAAQPLALYEGFPHRRVGAGRPGRRLARQRRTAPS